VPQLLRSQANDTAGLWCQLINIAMSIKSKTLKPEMNAKEKLRLTLAVRQAARKAEIAQQAARRAKASLKEAKKAAKLAKKTAKRAAKKARQRVEELKQFLKSAARQPKVVTKKTKHTKAPSVKRAPRRLAAPRNSKPEPDTALPSPGQPTPVSPAIPDSTDPGVQS
jgi:hypothetical protein